ncbi:MFS transporter [Methanofervidicoccus sp. A16]|nr:MFS transporter [Methanofervidicoccus sp. A16]
MIGIGLIAPLMSKYAQLLGASNFEIGIIFGSFALARTIAQIPVGYLSDKYGKKIFLLIGTFFYGFFTILYPFANSVVHLMVLRILNGISSSFINPVAGAYVATVAPKGKLGEYMGLFNSALPLGFSLGPLIGGVIAKWYGIEAPFYFCGALSFVSFLVCLFKLKNIKINRDGSFTYVSKLIVKYEGSVKRGFFSTKFLRDRCFFSAYIINLIYYIVNTGIIAYLAVYASDYIGLDQVGILIASTNLTMGALQRKFGEIYDRGGTYGTLLVCGGLLLSALGFYLLSIFSSFFTTLSPILKIFSALELVAIGGAMYLPAVNSLAMKGVSMEDKGMAMGLFSTSLNIGMFLGAVVLGYLADLFGLSNMYKISSIILTVVGVFAYFYIRGE